MHESVRAYVRESLPSSYSTVIEVGSLNINGDIRDLLDEDARYIGIDVQDGDGVDVVADFTTYQHPMPVDLILCLEVFEHTPKWPEIIASAERNLADAGTLIVTCATTGRHRHSDGLSGFYRNILKAELDTELDKHFTSFRSEVVASDLRAWARKGG